MDNDGGHISLEFWMMRGEGGNSMPSLPSTMAGHHNGWVVLAPPSPCGYSYPSPSSSFGVYEVRGHTLVWLSWRISLDVGPPQGDQSLDLSSRYNYKGNLSSLFPIGLKREL